MQETPEQTRERSKKVYRKPELVHVALRAEQTVLAHCKSAGTAGRGGAVAGVTAGQCDSMGS